MVCLHSENALNLFKAKYSSFKASNCDRNMLFIGYCWSPHSDPPKVAFVTDKLKVERGKEITIEFVIADSGDQRAKSDFNLNLNTRAPDTGRHGCIQSHVPTLGSHFIQYQG